MLEMHPNGYGFLRSPENNYSRERSDPFVPGTMIEKFRLRQGVLVKGTVQPGRRNQGPRLREILDVDGLKPEEYTNVKSFDQLTAINPEKWYRLETGPQPISTRVMDLLTPLGRGQRALIVAPPRSGKTILLQHISHGIATNYPEVKLIVLLVDERPEEVTDMERSTQGEVVSSTFDEPVKNHCRVAEMALERAKRLVESGRDVVILLDSITRLARAYNLTVPPSGRTLSGGLDPGALYPPKRFFGTARNLEFGGSLTIIATTLVDTGSRMDDVIYEEFKGTGNMELMLSRRLQERRIFPAFDIERSSTRREELLMSADELQRVYTMRRMLGHLMDTPGYDISSATAAVLQRLRATRTNYEFLETLTKDMA